MVLKALIDSGFTINPTKCEWLKERMTFLAHTLDEHRIFMEEKTKKAIMDFRTPKNKKALQSFLGLVNWNRFVEHLAEDTKPLESLLQLGQRYVWTQTQEDAFKKNNIQFQQTEGLNLVKKNWKFGIEADVSKIALGARMFHINPSSKGKKWYHTQVEN